MTNLDYVNKLRALTREAHVAKLDTYIVVAALEIEKLAIWKSAYDSLGDKKDVRIDEPYER